MNSEDFDAVIERYMELKEKLEAKYSENELLKNDEYEELINNIYVAGISKLWLRYWEQRNVSTSLRQHIFQISVQRQ